MTLRASLVRTGPGLVRATGALLVALCSACGTLSTPAALRSEPPQLTRTVGDAIGPTYRRLLALQRECFTSSGWLLDNAMRTVQGDYFESEGFAEITMDTTTPMWKRTDWILRLDRSGAGTTVRLWNERTLPEFMARWWNGVLDASIQECPRLL